MLKKRVRRAILTLVALVLVASMARSAVVRYFPYPYRDLIEVSAYQQRLDPHLLAAVVKVESNFRPQALSPKGARGLMQVMPDTAQWSASMMGISPVDPDLLFEPNLNVRIGAWYLAHLLDEFGGNEVVALAAYNSGRGKVSNWLQGKWDGTVSDIGSIPYSETRSYVRKVLFSKAVYSLVYGGRLDVSLADVGTYFGLFLD